MALATRPKPKANHKKRQANHHRQSRRYLKSYLPYLPMLAIGGLGTIVNTLWAPMAQAATTSGEVSRIEVLTGSQAAMSLLIVILAATAAFCFILIKYGLLLRRSLTRSEYFIVHHPWLDVAAVLVITAGIILTRSAYL